MKTIDIDIFKRNKSEGTTVARQEVPKVTLKERRKKIIQLFRFLISDILREKLQQRVLGKKWVESRRTARNQLRAERFRTTALELGGVLIKLGQYLSARFDLLPEEWLVELAKLQDSVPPVDFAELRPILEQDFGDKLEKLFLEFDTTPIAAASLGQVHRAVLLDGTEVAVKILRPGIGAIIEADLEALNRVIDFLRKRTDLGKLADLKGIAREFEVTLRRELDYQQEGKSAERIKENLKNLKYVYVPKVYWERTSSRVLTTEFIHGYKITNFAAIDAAQIDRYRAARILANCYLNQILIDGFFHADPHPGNLFVRQGPNGVEVAFVDFGMVGEITPDMKKQLRRMVVGVVQRDVEGIVEAMRKLNFIKKEEDVDKIRVAITFIIDKFLGLSVGQLKEMDYQKTFDELSYIIYSQPLFLPSDFSFLSRALETLIGVTTSLSSELNFLNETKPFMRRLIEDETKPNGATNGNSNLGGLLNPLVAEQLRDAALSLITLPRTLTSTLQKMDAERVQSQIQAQEVKQAADRVEKLGGRLVSSILAASALVSGTLAANNFVQYWRGQNQNKPK